MRLGCIKLMSNKMIYGRKYTASYLLVAAIVIAPSSKGLSQDVTVSACRPKLSKKSAMIYDDVKQKITPDTNLEELWKEVTRDLITANLLAREEASEPAKEALSCLKTNEP